MYYFILWHLHRPSCSLNKIQDFCVVQSCQPLAGAVSQLAYLHISCFSPIYSTHLSPIYSTHHVVLTTCLQLCSMLPALVCGSFCNSRCLPESPCASAFLEGLALLPAPAPGPEPISSRTAPNPALMGCPVAGEEGEAFTDRKILSLERSIPESC